MNIEVDQLIHTLESLLAGSMDCASARDNLANLSSPHLSQVKCNIEHYYADEDIREKDDKYKAFQNGELTKLVQHLRCGDMQKANTVTFLHES